LAVKQSEKGQKLSTVTVGCAVF